MNAQWRVTGAPAVEPVTLDEAKQHLRVDASDEDALIAALISAARIRLEEHCERAFITQTWRLSLSGWPVSGEIVLPRPALLTVTGITYVDSANVTTTYDAANYAVVTDAEPGIVMLKSGCSWPSAELMVGLPVRVAYTCGYGSIAANVPGPIRAAMLLLVGHLYENRESVTAQNLQVLPQGVEWLVEPYRITYLQEYG